MRRPFMVPISFVLSAAIAASAQVTVPDSFAGTWISGEKSGEGKRTLVISVSGNVVHLKEDFLSFKKPYSNESTLFLDKRGEKNLLNIPGADAPSEVHSITSLKKEKLIRKADYSTVSSNATYHIITNIRTTEEYSLSRDGKTLRLKSITSHDRRTDPGRPSTVPPGGITPAGSQLMVFPFERTYHRQQ